MMHAIAAAVLPDATDEMLRQLLEIPAVWRYVQRTNQWLGGIWRKPQGFWSKLFFIRAKTQTAPYGWRGNDLAR